MTKAKVLEPTGVGDDGTNDVLVSNVIRTNELQVWFVAEHVVDTPVVRVDDAKGDEPKSKGAGA